MTSDKSVIKFKSFKVI